MHVICADLLLKHLRYSGQNSHSQMQDTKLNDNERAQEYSIIFQCSNKLLSQKHRSLLQYISLYVTSNFQGFLVVFKCQNFVKCKKFHCPYAVNNNTHHL